MIETADIRTVRKGDIVRFARYALRVESNPVLDPVSVTIQGRTNIDGSPIVSKRFIGPRMVKIDRGSVSARYCTLCGKQHMPTCDERAES